MAFVFKRVWLCVLLGAAACSAPGPSPTASPPAANKAPASAPNPKPEPEPEPEPGSGSELTPGHAPAPGPADAPGPAAAPGSQPTAATGLAVLPRPQSTARGPASSSGLQPTAAPALGHAPALGPQPTTTPAGAATASPPALGPADAPPDASGWGVAAGHRYLEIVRGEATPDETLPMVIVIHGLGDRPHRDWLYAIDLDPKLKARMILPQAPTAYGRGYAWFPYRFNDNDEAALAGGISQAAAGLARMIEQLKAQRPTRGRVVVSGFSQGGMLSFALALKHPESIQFALPISGELPKPLWPAAGPKRGSAPRIVALHGTTDTVVSFASDDLLMQHLRRLGYAAELVSYPDVGHRISEEMSARAKRELSAAVAAIPVKAANGGKR